MRKVMLIIFAITFYVVGNSQRNTALSDFLDRDLSQVLQEHIDSLNDKLFTAEAQIRNEQINSISLKEATSSSIGFFLLLGKLENSLPLNREDSLMINFEHSNQQITELVVDSYALQLITDKDPLYINNFPKLAKMIKENTLIIEPAPLRSLMTAPEIEIPPSPSLTGNNKQLIAQAWLNYIYELSNECKDAQQQIGYYTKKEKAKIPDGNLNNIIKLRQKFAMFIIENYCKK